MTSDEFRSLAMGVEGAEEKSHFGKADFRLRNKIFASLPDASMGVVNLTAEQQEVVCGAEPGVFSPVPGAWGGKGWTRVSLASADETTVRSAIVMAAAKTAPAKR
jgi:hypothetical protein